MPPSSCGGSGVFGGGFGNGNGGGAGGGGWYGGGGAWSNDFSVCGGGGGGSSGYNSDQAVILLDWENGIQQGYGKCKISWGFPVIVIRRIIQRFIPAFITGAMPGENQLRSFTDCFLNGQSLSTASSKGCFIQGATEAFQLGYIEGRDPFIYLALQFAHIVGVLNFAESNNGCYIFGAGVSESTTNCYIKVNEYTGSYRHCYISVISTNIKESFTNCHITSNSSQSVAKNMFIFGVVKPAIDPKMAYINA